MGIRVDAQSARLYVAAAVSHGAARFTHQPVNILPASNYHHTVWLMPFLLLLLLRLLDRAMCDWFTMK